MSYSDLAGCCSQLCSWPGWQPSQQSAPRDQTKTESNDLVRARPSVHTRGLWDYNTAAVVITLLSHSCIPCLLLSPRTPQLYICCRIFFAVRKLFVVLIHLILAQLEVYFPIAKLYRTVMCRVVREVSGLCRRWRCRPGGHYSPPQTLLTAPTPSD